MVRISMDSFVKNYQPDRYAAWKLGEDRGPHPEDDQSKLYKNRKSKAIKPAATVTTSGEMTDDDAM